jgi:hypothetical protein
LLIGKNEKKKWLASFAGYGLISDAISRCAINFGYPWPPPIAPPGPSDKVDIFSENFREEL